MFSDGITTLKKKHFEELIQRRANQIKLQADVNWLNQQVWQCIDQIRLLSQDRDNAVAALEDKRQDLMSIQEDYNKLYLVAESDQKMSESRAVALDLERKKTAALMNFKAQLYEKYHKMKASFDEEKRKGLEREEQIAKEREQFELTVLDLRDQLREYKARELQQKSSVKPKMKNVKWEDEQPKSQRLSNRPSYDDEPKFSRLSNRYSYDDEQPKSPRSHENSPLRNWDGFYSGLGFSDNLKAEPKRSRRSNDDYYY